MKGYHHLTLETRLKLETLLDTGQRPTGAPSGQTRLFVPRARHTTAFHASLDRRFSDEHHLRLFPLARVALQN